MTATDLFSAGRLRRAIDAQVAKVEADPTDNSARLFLFELLAFAGDLDRARRQLDRLRADHRAVAQFRCALDAEDRRRAVFAGTSAPGCLGAAPEHLLLRLEALPHLARGEHAEAQRRLDKANGAAPATGTLNGTPFAGLCDADERFGTALEVFAPGGAYSWVALEQVARVALSPPQRPRDVLWRAARLSLVDGSEVEVLLPGLYPGTHEHPDDEVRLGRATEWLGADGELAHGVGGRVFLTENAVIRFADVMCLERAGRSCS